MMGCPTGGFPQPASRARWAKASGRNPGGLGRITQRCLVAVTVGLAGPLMLITSGCGKEDAHPDHQSIDGTIGQINLADSQITLRYFSPKHKIETSITGKVNENTEIFINGVLSSIEDLREGERVNVIGWVRGHGADRQVEAVKLTVERAETIRRESAGASTTQPGDG